MFLSGQRIKFNDSDIFSCPLEPVRSPLGFKEDTKTESGARYMKYDVVYYRGPNDQHESIGQIRNFSRENAFKPMQVCIQPLTISGGLKGMNTPGGYQNRHRKAGVPGKPSTIQKKVY
jgi:hypothetical protein